MSRPVTDPIGGLRDELAAVLGLARPRRGLRRVITDWLLADSSRLDRMEKKMAVTQADLDSIAAELTSDTGALKTELDRLAALNPNLDLSGVRTALDNLGALVPSTTGGGEGPIAAEPGTPVIADPAVGNPAVTEPVPGGAAAGDPAPVTTEAVAEADPTLTPGTPGSEA